MARQVNIQDPNQREGAGTRVDCVSGNCCNPATYNRQWDMECIRCIFCPDDAAMLAHIRSTITVEVYDAIWYDDILFDGTEWVYDRFDAGGSYYRPEETITLLRHPDCNRAADTLYHETIHALQPSNMTPNEMEYDAYAKTENWLIRNQLPGSGAFRTTDAHGNTVADEAAIKDFVDRAYPTSTSDGWRAINFANDPTNQTEWYNDLTGAREWRPAQQGDRVPGNEETEGKSVIPSSEFYCE